MSAINLGNIASAGEYLRLIDLGEQYTQEMKEDISSGRFDICKVGCYLTINSTRYIFAHPDYWYNKGDSGNKCTAHHMVVISADTLTNSKMASSTATPYATSYMNSTTIPNTIVPKIQTDFGSANILQIRESLVSTVSSNGYPSASSFSNVKAVIPSQIMIFGTMPCTYFTTTNYEYYAAGIDNTQLELFAKRPDLIPLSSKYWLRDIYNSSNYTAVFTDGTAITQSYSTTSIGARPVFALC